MGGRKEGFYPGQAIDLVREAGARNFVFMSQVYIATRVACGDFVGSIFGYGSPWDSAASAILVEEAGGIVTDMQGKKRRYDDWGDGCVLSANQQIHHLLLEIIKQAQDD
jgi:fructose-1,6-bisphosphatase/inositol monophosphatase family enzyme